MTGTFDRNGQGALVFRTGTSHATRQDFTTLRDEFFELSSVLVVDLVLFFKAECANPLFSASSEWLFHVCVPFVGLEWEIVIIDIFGDRGKATTLRSAASLWC